VISSETALFEAGTTHGMHIQSFPNNHIIEVKEDLSFNLTKIEKKISIER